MGNDPYKNIHLNINDEDIKQVIDEKKEDNLYKLYVQYTQTNGYLTKENFNIITRLDDEKISDNLFFIFQSSKGKIYYPDLKNFYVAFANERLKNILLSFLILGKADKAEVQTYCSNVSQLININEQFVILAGAKIIQFISNEAALANTSIIGGIKDRYYKKKGAHYIYKELLMSCITQLLNRNALKFSFFHQIIPSSKLIKEKNFNEKHYICDCLKEYLNLSNINLYDKMEQPFLRDKLVSRGHLSFENLEIMMQEYQVNKKLIDIIIKYLKIVTMKNSIIFDDFKNLMININAEQSHSKKKSFLFKMILTILNQKISVRGSQLKKILQIENNDVSEEGKINQSDLENIKDININNTIEEYIGYMENLILIPYIRYNLMADAPELKKKIINFILNKKTTEEYLIEHFDECNKFYPVNIEFWNALTDEQNEPNNAELEINNSLIAEKDDIFYITKNEEEQSIKENKIQTSPKENKQDLKNDKNKNNDKNNNKEEVNALKKEDKKEGEKETEIIKEKKKEAIRGKLKNNVKYGDNYVIICGEIYDKISTNFEFDYLIELEKTTIFYTKEEENKKEEQKEVSKKDSNEKTEEGKAVQKIEEKVGEKIAKELELDNDGKNNKINNIQNSIEVLKEEKKNLSKENILKISERVGVPGLEISQENLKVEDKKEKCEQNSIEQGKTEQKIDEKEGVKTEILSKSNNSENTIDQNLLKKETDNNKVENKASETIEEKQKEEKNEQNIIKKSELIIDKDNNYLRKKEDENNGIKEYIVDFYPIKFVQLSFDYIYNKVDGKYQELLKKDYELQTPEQKAEFEKKKNKEKTQRTNRVNEYNEKVQQLNELISEKTIDKKLAKQKEIALKEQYKDLFDKEIKFKKREFLGLLNAELNNILSTKTNSIKKIWKNMTTKEFKNCLIKYDDKLTEDNFDLIFYTSDNKCIASKENMKLNDINDNFILIIFDPKNEEGKTSFTILEENENPESKKTDNNFKNVGTFEIISKEELQKIKDEQGEKEKLKKKKEKEEKERLDKLEKERKKANEKITHPPYGIPNFGNTCYFNSVNQIILNLPIMQQLFSEKNIKYMINKENKFGYKGKLVSAFMPLYELYPYQIEDNVKYLKSLVGKVNETFNNQEQQDAHEYLNFVLEGLHEELNIKSSKIYIEDNDENYKYNTEDELGNIAWANNLRRNASFIDSIFMFQLKSNLICQKCGTKKVNFETSYVFNLPLSLCKIVTVHINLFRLPFKYKIYYAKINKDFEAFSKNEDNIDKSITETLCDYYSVKLNFEQKQEQAVYLSFEFDFEREKCIGDLLKLIRKISLLELEPEDKEITLDKEEIKEYKINHYTELIAYFRGKNKIINNNMLLDKFVDINDRIELNIYEVLNTNGFSLVNQNYMKHSMFNLYSYKFNKTNISSTDDFKNKIEDTNFFEKKIKLSEKQNQKKEESTTATPDNTTPVSKNNITEIPEKKCNILSINDKLAYLDYCEKDKPNYNKNEIISESLVPIVHYKRDLSDVSPTVFLDFYHQMMNYFPMQLLMLNNSNNKLSGKDLYNYIWDYNSLYMNHPNKKTDDFWFNIEPNTKEQYKKCYPFVIRIVKPNKKYSFPYKCSKCHWYNFCIGCVLSPYEKNVKFEPDDIIFVDWCNLLVKEEIDNQNFYYKNISKEEITLCIESEAKNDKDNKHQSIQDCFDLFFAKELLEDPLSCRVCQGPQNFAKNYEINKLPYVLILSLKRFKYNENNNFKLKQLITYPIDNFKLKDKTYNLFGVVYHYGGINSGHYICAVRKDNKWIQCDDHVISEIEIRRVMNSNAYILFYISNDSINNYSYYNCMKSLLQHIVIDKLWRTTNYSDNNNFFKGEPIRVKSKGNGYVVEDYNEDFIIEDKNKENNKNKNEIKDEIKNEQNAEKEGKEQNKIMDAKQNGKVKVKFESVKDIEIIDKNEIEKLILIDEQKKEN